MRALFIFFWAILIWQVGAWAFAPPKPAAQMPPGDGRAFGSNEEIFARVRASTRKDAFRALELPWSSLCTETGRKEFISGLGEYYFHRQNQTDRYPEIHGKLGADYVAQQWASADDKRIDRLTQEAYSHGYLKPAEFQAVARKMITTVVAGERLTGRGCAG
jgi:hypothetical protein